MTFGTTGLEGRARWFLVANGLLVPFLALQLYFHWMIWIASAWAVTFPASTWLIAKWFHRATVTPLRDDGIGITPDIPTLRTLQAT